MAGNYVAVAAAAPGGLTVKRLTAPQPLRETPDPPARQLSLKAMGLVTIPRRALPLLQRLRVADEHGTGASLSTDDVHEILRRLG